MASFGMIDSDAEDLFDHDVGVGETHQRHREMVPAQTQSQRKPKPQRPQEGGADVPPSRDQRQRTN